MNFMALILFYYMNMTTNMYTIELVENAFENGTSLDTSPVEKIKGVESARYDAKKHRLEVGIEGKHDDDAAEILQEAVAFIRRSGDKDTPSV